MTEEILKLHGKEAKAFLEYDSRELTEEEKRSLEKARNYYNTKCKT
ncbi:MAG: hypothetical protein KGL95_09140 [Patescibacteria group bacterium]|nr:hypothetical protein [Patescibacteria group bacterium]